MRLCATAGAQLVPRIRSTGVGLLSTRVYSKSNGNRWGTGRWSELVSAVATLAACPSLGSIPLLYRHILLQHQPKRQAYSTVRDLARVLERGSTRSVPSRRARSRPRVVHGLVLTARNRTCPAATRSYARAAPRRAGTALSLPSPRLQPRGGGHRPLDVTFALHGGFDGLPGREPTSSSTVRLRGSAIASI